MYDPFPGDSGLIGGLLEVVNIIRLLKFCLSGKRGKIEITMSLIVSVLPRFSISMLCLQ